MRHPDAMNELRQAWLGWNATMPGIPEDAGVSLVFGPADLPSATF
jgi:hypothetical protein